MTIKNLTSDVIYDHSDATLTNANLATRNNSSFNLLHMKNVYYMVYWDSVEDAGIEPFTLHQYSEIGRPTNGIPANPFESASLETAAQVLKMEMLFAASMQNPEGLPFQAVMVSINPSEDPTDLGAGPQEVYRSDTHYFNL